MIIENKLFDLFSKEKLFLLKTCTAPTVRVFVKCSMYARSDSSLAADQLINLIYSQQINRLPYVCRCTLHSTVSQWYRPTYFFTVTYLSYSSGLWLTSINEYRYRYMLLTIGQYYSYHASKQILSHSMSRFQTKFFSRVRYRYKFSQNNGETIFSLLLQNCDKRHETC